MVQDRDGSVAREHEIAVHAVDDEVGRNGVLGGSEGLGDDGAAVDAARAGGVP